MKNTITCKSNKLLHLQVKEFLLKEFALLKPGDRITKTYKDYSAQFGTSLVTVQKAMAELVREKIIAGRPSKGTFLIKKIGSKTNYKFGLIGLTPDDKGSILSGILQTSWMNNCSIEFIGGKDFTELRQRYLGLIKNNEIDGILLVSNAGYFEKVIKDLNSSGTPFVYADSAIKQEGCNLVYIDDEKTSKLAANQLIKMGHKDIGYIGECDDLNRNDKNICVWFRARFWGFEKALVENNISFNRRSCARATLTAEDVC